MERVRIVRDLDGIGPAWEDLAERTGAGPFARPAWLRAWWHAHGRGRLRVLCAERDGELVAVAPIAWRAGAAVAPVNVDTPAYAITARDGAARRLAARGLLALGARHVLVRRVDGDGPTARALLEAAGRERARAAVVGRLRSPVIHLDSPEAAADPLAGVTPRLRKELRRVHRRLDERGGCAIDVVRGVDGLDRALDEAFALEAAQWKGAAGTAIASRPAREAFYRRVAHDFARAGALRLVRLRCRGLTVAFSLGVRGPAAHYALKSGFDPRFAAFSPGHLVSEAEVLLAAREGAARFEFLGGPEPYKLAWTRDAVERVDIVIAGPGARGALAVAAHRAGERVARRARDARRRPAGRRRG